MSNAATHFVVEFYNRFTASREQTIVEAADHEEAVEAYNTARFGDAWAHKGWLDVLAVREASAAQVATRADADAAGFEGFAVMVQA